MRKNMDGISDRKVLPRAGSIYYYTPPRAYVKGFCRGGERKVKIFS